MKFQRVLCLGALLCSFTSAFAAVCDVKDQPDERLRVPHKTIETLNGTVLVAGTLSTPPVVRAETALLLGAIAVTPADLARQMREEATRLKDLLYRFTNLRDYMFFALSEKTFTFIIRGQRPQKFLREQEEARALYQDELAQAVRTGVEFNVRQPILLLNMGPLNFLRLQHPELFTDVTISAFDTTPLLKAEQKSQAQAAAPPAVTAPAPPPAPADPDAIAAEFRRQFARNPKTLSTFNSFVRDFKLSNYQGQSDNQIRARAQRLVFARAKPLMGRWVDAKIASLRAAAQEPAPAATIATDDVRKKEFALGKALLNHKGTGMFLVEEASVDAITAALVNACRRQP